MSFHATAFTLVLLTAIAVIMFRPSLLLLLLLTTQILCCKEPPEKNSEIKNFHDVHEKNTQNEELQKVKSEIIRLLKQINNDDWQSFHLVIEAPPFTNKGFNTVPTFLDESGPLKAPWKPDQQFDQKVMDLIFQVNKITRCNEVVFFTKRDDYDKASIFASYNQNIETVFQSYLPDSLKGKTTPWYKLEK